MTEQRDNNSFKESMALLKEAMERMENPKHREFAERVLAQYEQYPEATVAHAMIQVAQAMGLTQSEHEEAHAALAIALTAIILSKPGNYEAVVEGIEGTPRVSVEVSGLHEQELSQELREKLLHDLTTECVALRDQLNVSDPYFSTGLGLQMFPDVSRGAITIFVSGVSSTRGWDWNKAERLAQTARSVVQRYLPECSITHVIEESELPVSPFERMVRDTRRNREERQ